MAKHPVCSKCGHMLDPTLEDDCDRYAVIGGEVYCKFCLSDFLRDEMDEAPFFVAERLGFTVCQTMAGGIKA